MESPSGVVDGAGNILSSDHCRMIAVANPTTAPYGAAAQQVLMAMGLWDKLNESKRVVVGETSTRRGSSRPLAQPTSVS